MIHYDLQDHSNFFKVRNLLCTHVVINTHARERMITFAHRLYTNERNDADDDHMHNQTRRHCVCRRCSNEIHGGRLNFNHSPRKLDELRHRLRRVVYTRSLPRARDGDRNHYALWARDPRLGAHSNPRAEEFTSRSASTRYSFGLERPSVLI